jgi:RNA polymerase sigma-70 factor (sigma-E family)
VSSGRDIDGLERFLADRERHLLATAALLAGNRAAGEDLLQSALERLLRNWRRIEGNPEGYLRRTLCNLAVDGHRRQVTRRRGLLLLRGGAQPHPGDAIAEVDLRDALVRLLVQLPARQRAVLVLRYWEQLTDAETAEVLGCAEGTVRSAASRGLQQLRDLAASLQGTEAVLTRGSHEH